MMRRWLITLCTVLVVGLAAVIAPHSTKAESGQFVTIQDNSYSPEVLTISVGDHVYWTNLDTVDHTATSDTGAWDTGTISGVQTVNGVTVISGSDAIFFNTAGTYPYHDRFQPSMHGTIIVQVASATESPTPTATSVPTATPSPTPTPSPTATSIVPPAPTATPAPPRLRLTVGGALRAGRSSTVRVIVRDSIKNLQVAGATVALDGRKVGIKPTLRRKTSKGGVATFSNVRPLRAGVIKVRASKHGFVSSSTTLHVRAASHYRPVTVKWMTDPKIVARSVPDPVRVHVGQPVIWDNVSNAPHTATARDGSFDSPPVFGSGALR